MRKQTYLGAPFLRIGIGLNGAGNAVHIINVPKVRRNVPLHDAKSEMSPQSISDDLVNVAYLLLVGLCLEVAKTGQRGDGGHVAPITSSCNGDEHIIEEHIRDRVVQNSVLDG